MSSEEGWFVGRKADWRTRHAGFVAHPTHSLVAKIYTEKSYQGDLDVVLGLHQHVRDHLSRSSHVLPITSIYRSGKDIIIVMPRAQADIQTLCVAAKARTPTSAVHYSSSQESSEKHRSKSVYGRVSKGSAAGSESLSGRRSAHGRRPIAASTQASKETLSRLIPSTPCPVSSTSDIILWLYQMATGISEMHDSGYVHGDIKPSNFLLLDGNLMLADYDCMQPMYCSSRGVVGTPAFMCPSIIRAHLNREAYEVRPEIDLWGLGMTLLWMLTGQSPFEDTVSKCNFRDRTSLMTMFVELEAASRCGWVVVPPEWYAAARTELGDLWPFVHFVLAVTLVPSIQHRFFTASDIVRLMRENKHTRSILRHHDVDVESSSGSEEAVRPNISRRMRKVLTPDLNVCLEDGVRLNQGNIRGTGKRL